MYSSVVDLLQPHTILFFWACLALVQLWRKRNAPTRRLWPLFAPLFLLAALSTPAAAHLALLSLESDASPWRNGRPTRGPLWSFPRVSMRP